jgi:plasmid stabilization system protein ParE
MAPKKVSWSERAEKELNQILLFYIERNGSNSYSLKLLEKIDQKIKLIQRFNFIGRISNEEDIRVAGMEQYQIFYRILADTIEIMSIWDIRQNPEKRIDQP